VEQSVGISAKPTFLLIIISLGSFLNVSEPLVLESHASKLPLPLILLLIEQLLLMLSRRNDNDLQCDGLITFLLSAMNMLKRQQQ
jgi:hypothetical protein